MGGTHRFSRLDILHNKVEAYLRGHWQHSTVLYPGTPKGVARIHGQCYSPIELAGFRRSFPCLSMGEFDDVVPVQNEQAVLALMHSGTFPSHKIVQAATFGSFWNLWFILSH